MANGSLNFRYYSDLTVWNKIEFNIECRNTKYRNILIYFAITRNIFAAYAIYWKSSSLLAIHCNILEPSSICCSCNNCDMSEILLQYILAIYFIWNFSAGPLWYRFWIFVRTWPMYSFIFALSITYMRCSCADYNRYHKRHKYLSLHGWPVLSPFSGSYRELITLSHSECCISHRIYAVCAQIRVRVRVCH